jgi:hypothetical protein
MSTQENMHHFHPEVFPFYLEAGKDSCSVIRLSELARNPHPKVRLRVAENHKCPAFVLEKLACDRLPEVRCAVTVNPNVTVEILRSLSLDADVSVRMAVAEEMHTPFELLNKLAHDPNPYICTAAIRTVKKLQRSGLFDGDKAVLRRLFNAGLEQSGRFEIIEVESMKEAY